MLTELDAADIADGKEESEMKGREFLKANWELLDGFRSDQSRGEDPPALQKSLKDGLEITELPAPESGELASTDLLEIIDSRRSIRKFTDDPLSLEELSLLLWSTQGVQKVLGNGVATLRTVPSGGARHPFNTYLLVNNVYGLQPGKYLYMPLDHSLARLGDQVPVKDVIYACLDQTFCGESAVTFVWATVPYRTEWRYGPVSHKIIALDAGHLCQNLYLVCTALGLGTCAIGAYDQAAVDGLMGFDGEDEFTVYIAPVGRRK